MPNLRNLLCGEAAGLAIIEVQWTTTQKKLSKNAKYFLAFFSNFCSFLVKLYITNFKTEFKVFSGILKKISLQCTTKKSETGISNYHPVPSSLYTFNQKNICITIDFGRKILHHWEKMWVAGPTMQRHKNFLHFSQPSPHFPSFCFSHFSSFHTLVLTFSIVKLYPTFFLRQRFS